MKKRRAPDSPPLTKEQIRIALEMLEAGKTVKDIADELGMIYANGAAHNRLKRNGIDVRSVRKQYGISMDTWDSEIPIIKSLIRAKVSAKDIASKYHLNYKQFYQILYRRGISIRREQFYQNEGMVNE